MLLANRQNEILFWLQTNSVEGYLILDDNELESFLEAPDPDLDLHFIKTIRETGLRRCHIKKAINILNNNLD